MAIAHITKPWVKTPCIESAVLSKAAGCKIQMKLETLQPGRSFKSRGVGNFMLSRVLERQAEGRSQIYFYISSGGNAGLAAVRAAVALGCSCTVVVPISAKPRMVELLKTAGAQDVIQIGETWREADTFLREQLIAKDSTGVYVPPFDHPDVWAGNATLIDEVVADWQLGWQGPNKRPKPAAVICSVGGGGLFCGVVRGLKSNDWSDVPVIAVETQGAESLNKSLEAGELITLPGISSLAKSLGATRVAEQAFTYALDTSTVKSVVLPDKDAALGCLRLADDERIIVELSCGVNIAMCYGERLEKALGRKLKPEDEVVVVVCGGSDVTLATLQEWRADFGLQ